MNGMYFEIILFNFLNEKYIIKFWIILMLFFLLLKGRIMNVVFFVKKGLKEINVLFLICDKILFV